MPACNLTRLIPSNECIGDSLRTINANFSSLDVNFCSNPYTKEGKNVSVDLKIDSINRSYLEISSVSSPRFFNRFNYTSSTCNLTSIPLSDSTQIQAYDFPYTPNVTDTKPFGSFEIVSHNEGNPELSLFWFANSNSLGTVFALNSSVNFFEQNTIQPDGEVLCFLKDGSKLYLGGAFKTIGNLNSSYLTVIETDSGNLHPSLGYTGSVLSHPLTSLMADISEGYVCSLAKFVTDNEEYLVVGGDFKSSNLGRSLFIYNITTDETTEFYVNGKVNDIQIYDNDIYVVGQFDFLNIGTDPAGINSGLRVECQNFAKIAISENISSSSINRIFAGNTFDTFEISMEINCIERYKNIIFVGGDFQTVNQLGEIIHKNLLIIDLEGNLIPEWKFIFNKPIHTLLLDENVIYVGGDFTAAYSYDDLYYENVISPNKNTFNYAAAVSFANPAAPVLNYEWKPNFNNSVYKLAVQNSAIDSYIYAVGKFSKLNNKASTHIAALTKAVDMFNNNFNSNVINWNIHLETFPSKFTNALYVENETTMLVGGSFKTVNNQIRPFFARVHNPNEVQPSLGLVFDVGLQIISSNQSLAFDFNSAYTTRIVTYPGLNKTVNKTIFELSDKNLKTLAKNQLCRFFVRRPGNSNSIGVLPETDDLFQNTVYIVGWSLDFRN